MSIVRLSVEVHRRAGWMGFGDVVPVFKSTHGNSPVNSVPTATRLLVFVRAILKVLQEATAAE